MKKLLVILAVLAMAQPATAATRGGTWPLHPGSTGKRVAALQWMISGHCPNRFTPRCGGHVKPTLKRYAKGQYGARTKAGLLAYRFRLGFPANGQCGAKASKLTTDVTPWFFALLRGSRDKHGHLIATRPVCWVALASARVEKAAQTQPSKTALAIKQWELAQVGTHEQCGGSCNRGYVKGPGGWSVDEIQSRFFGLRGLAWCEIFQEDGFKIGGYHPIPFSPAPFSVIPTYRWAASHNFATARPKIGSLMVWLGQAGHIGYVIGIDADSAGNAHGYTTVEGNSSDGVYIRHYPVPGSSLRLFINLPGVA